MRHFGFDMGTTSVGFAVIDYDEMRETGRILRLGARIFPEARDSKSIPLNQTRRAMRMMRRQLRRRRARRRSLNMLLCTHGLLPAFGTPEWNRVIQWEPYALRAKALKEALTANELGRILYHLAKHRHFKERDPAETGEVVAEADAGSNTSKTTRRGKTASADSTRESEEIESQKARVHFVDEVRRSGKTIGALLAARPAGNKRRGEQAIRALVEEEYSRILASQEPHHPVLHDPEFTDALHEVIFFQRPVFWRRNTLGQCSLLPDETELCRKGSWLSQERRMLEKINNLEIAGGNARRLDDEERAVIVGALRRQKTLSWGGARKLLEPLFKAHGESTRGLKFNHETSDADTGGLRGNVVEIALAQAFGEQWENHPRKEELRESLPAWLWEADYKTIGSQRIVIQDERQRTIDRDACAGELHTRYGATKAAAQALSRTHFPQGWEPYSTAALRKILPELQKGERFGSLLSSPDFAQWRDDNFPGRNDQTGDLLDFLPSPRQKDEAQRISALRNPTVVRTLNELRKVLNNLIRVYGKPDVIRIELARDIGKSAQERDEMEKAISKNERARKVAREDLIKEGIADPRRRDIEKWLLWHECGKQCPYSGDKIERNDLFSGNPKYQVEHIWPLSQSLDNSMGNKTLCRTDLNQAKNNRIPFDYFSDRPDEWQAAKDRIHKMAGKSGMSRGKVRRFCAQSMPDDFVSRQLNDTGYAARAAMAQLRRLRQDGGSDKTIPVYAVTGRVTAQLRRLWDLNNILGEGEKNRADHRHHAIDALVVALTREQTTAQLSHYFAKEVEYRRGRGAKPQADLSMPPWSSLRMDVEAAVNEIIVSHRVRKKVSGPLHEGTVYGDTGEERTDRTGTYRFVVSRKPLAALTENAVKSIRDQGARRLVEERISEAGGIDKKPFATPLMRGPNGPEIRRVRLMIPKKLDGMIKLAKGFAPTGNNHHIAIYRNAEGKVDARVVSLLEATRRLARRQPVIARDGGDGMKLVMSLSPGDTFHVPAGDHEGYWTVKGISQKGQITCRLINDASTNKQQLWQPRSEPLLKLGVRKVSVDPIGRVHFASD